MLIASAVVFALIAGGVAFATIPDPGTGVIHGCYNTSLAHGNPTGALRVIDTAKPGGSCASWETALNWNANGVTGARGPTILPFVSDSQGSPATGIICTSREMIVSSRPQSRRELPVRAA